MRLRWVSGFGSNRPRRPGCGRCRSNKRVIMRNTNWRLDVLVAYVVFTGVLWRRALCVTIFDEPVGGFDCELQVRGSLSLNEQSQHHSEGVAVYQALLLWKDIVNDEIGGISIVGAGKPMRCAVDLFIEDDNSNITQAVDIVTKAVNEADVLIAPIGDEMTDAASNVSESSHKVMISGASSMTSVFDMKKFLYGMLIPVENTFSVILSTLAMRGARSVACIQENATDTNAMCERIASIAADAGFLHHNCEVVPEDADNSYVRAAMSNIQAQDVDVIFGCTHTTVCNTALKLAEAMNIDFDAKLFSNCVTEADFSENVGFAGNYVMGPTQWWPSMDYRCEVTGLTAAEFASTYELRFNSTPTVSAAAYFAGMTAWMTAVQQGQTPSSGTVTVYLSRMQLETVFGTVVFNRNAMSYSAMPFVQALSDGLKLVHPLGIVEEAMVYPMPSWSTQQCWKVHGQEDCRCHPEGCPPCSNEDYTYTLADCDVMANQHVTFHLEEGVCNPETGVDPPTQLKVRCSYLPVYSAQAIAVIGLTILGVVLGVGCIIAVYRHRTNKYVLAAQPSFLYLFLLGVVVSFVGNAMPLGEVTNAQCLGNAWLLGIGIDLALGAVNAKMYRVWRIFGNRRLVRLTVREREMFVFIGSVVFLESCLLIAWWVFDQQVVEFEQHYDYGVQIHTKTCNITRSKFVWSCLAFKAALLVAACFFSHQTRNVDRKYLQSNLIMYALYQIFVVTLLALVVCAVLNNGIDQVFVRMLTIIAVNFAGVIFVVCIRFVSIYQAASEKQTMPHQGQRQRSTNGVEDDNLTMEEFTSFLFSPGELTNMTNKLNKLEDDNAALQQQVQEFVAYFTTGAASAMVRSYVLIDRKTPTTSLASTPDLHFEDKL